MLEEPETIKRDKMLQYYAFLMQDAVELNFPTVKRAHAAVLQEIEKGKLNWEQSEEIEKTKQKIDTHKDWYKTRGWGVLLLFNPVPTSIKVFVEYKTTMLLM